MNIASLGAPADRAGPDPRALGGLRELRRRRLLAADNAGGRAAQRRQQRLGLLTPQRRVELLLDAGSHLRAGTLVHSDDLRDWERTIGGDMDVMGFGTVGGRPVAYFASNPAIKGGSGTPATLRQARAFRRIVEKSALPVFYLMQGGGARITDAISSRFAGYPGSGLGAYKAFPRRGIFLTAVLGPYYPPWTMVQADFAVMTQASNASITSAPVVEEATGQKVSADELGGSEVHARVTGQVDMVVPDEAEAIETLRRVFSYLPSNAFEPTPVVRLGDPPDRPTPELRGILPASSSRAYDVKKIVAAIVDQGSFIEWSPRFARNLVTGIARMDGRTVAIMANQPMYMGGVLDSAALIKARRVLGVSEDLHLPVVFLQDVPGVLTVKEEEHKRLLTQVFDTAVAKVRNSAPKVTLILRKGYGFAYFAMNGSDPEGITFAWPTARIGFIGPEPGARVIYRRQIESAPDPKQFLQEKADELRHLSEPWEGASLGFIDDIIDPIDTRAKIVRALEATRRRAPSALPSMARSI